MNVDRVRPAALALAAVALAAAALTGCQGGGGGAAAGSPGSAGVTEVTAEPTVEAPEEPVSEAPSEPASAPPVTKAPVKPGTKPRVKPTGKKPTPPVAPSPGCADTPPGPDDVDPDEIAVYRVEELDGSTGKVNLVIQHGVWGCSGGDGEGKPFVGTGEESRWALDQAAYVTAVNPVVDTSTSRCIGVQELIDWIDAHPDAGLVFRYETGDDGAIHRLEQVYAP